MEILFLFFFFLLPVRNALVLDRAPAAILAYNLSKRIRLDLPREVELKGRSVLSVLIWLSPKQP